MDDHILIAAHIQDYTAMLQTEERAPATQEKYGRDAGVFLNWLGTRPVSKENAAQWKACLLSAGLAPATVNAKLCAINGLFRFLGWDECRVKFVKQQRRTFRDESRELSREEFHRLVSAAGKLQKNWLALLMETICAAGIRVSELRFITVQAARMGRADIALKGKIRTILLPAKLCQKLLAYAKKQKIASGEIFLTEDGRPLTRNRIWRAMKSLCKTAGVQESKVFPHNLRHLFAAEFYQTTHDIVKLADVLGHSSINTTRIYLLSSGAEHVRQLNRLRLIS